MTECINVVLLGHNDNGKTTLAAAITCFANQLYGSSKAYFQNSSDECGAVEVSSSKCKRRFYDYASSKTACAGLKRHLDQADLAVLVVNPVIRAQCGDRDCHYWMRKTGVKCDVLFGNKAFILEKEESELHTQAVKEEIVGRNLGSTMSRVFLGMRCVP